MLGNLHVRFGGRALAGLAPHPTPLVGSSILSPGTTKNPDEIDISSI